MVRLLAPAALLAAASTAASALSLPALARRQRIAVCDCGVIDTTDPNQAIWTDYFEVRPRARLAALRGSRIFAFAA